MRTDAPAQQCGNIAAPRSIGGAAPRYALMVGETQSSEAVPAVGLREWARRWGLARKLAVALALAAVAAGIATYATLSGNPPYGPEPRTVRVILLIDLVLLLSFGAVVARRLVRLWAERRRGSAGSRLHTQLVALFSFVAVAPAIIVAVFSALFLNLGLQSWFSEGIRTALQESLAVAEAYTNEHHKVIRGDILAMATDLNRQAPRLALNPQLFNQVITAQARVRSLSEAIVFRRSGVIVARTPLSFGLQSDAIRTAALNRAAGGDIIFLTGNNEDRVRALLRLDGFIDSYLYISRFVDPRVLLHAERTRRAVATYERFEGERFAIEVTFAIIFIVVALLLLLVAVWFGLTFATRMSRPIGGLIGATERVREGDLSVRVAEGRDDNEISTLSRAFNRMTSQLQSQRADLVIANEELDSRQRFTVAVLEGVSAGVIGVDPDGHINLPNRSAAALLGAETDALVGRAFSEVVPEMAPLLEEARARPHRLVQDQITLERQGAPRRLLVQVTAESAGAEIMGFVVTFDDVTELVTAQRTAAWADVARRIAHEIKNPLTPIRLSAERLKRRYAGEIETDPDVFARCTDTIIRQVVAIGRMVDEFSAFARMPSPVLRPEDVVELTRRAVFLQREAHPEIEFVCSFPDRAVMLRCDERQIGQVLTNLLLNAAQSIGDRAPPAVGELAPGRIEARVVDGDREVTLDVIDNGRGFPATERDRLSEPYVTTRPKGTGLGLAIVKKIAEDHGARLALTDRPEGGACVRITFIGAAVEVTDEGDRGDGEAGDNESRMAAYGA